MSKHDFTREEFADRLARVRKAIADAGLDWMVLFHPVSIHWLTGSDAKSYQAFQCLLVSADDRPLIMVMRESERAEVEADTLVDEAVGWGGPEPGDPLDVFTKVARDHGLLSARVGIEVPAYYLHPHHYVRVKDLLGEALVAEPTNLVPSLKAVKSPQELAISATLPAWPMRRWRCLPAVFARAERNLRSQAMCTTPCLGQRVGWQPAP